MSGLFRNSKSRLAHALLGGSWGSLKPLYISALLIGLQRLKGCSSASPALWIPIMVGTISPAAIAAVGLTTQPRLMMLIIVQAINIGITSLVARRKGARDEAGVRSCLHQFMYISFFVGVSITLLVYLMAKPIMRLAGANDETLSMAVSYYQIIALGFIPASLQLSVCTAFRGLGKTKVTLSTHMLSNVVNIILNLLLIGGQLGFPRLEVRGAAIATTLGSAAAFIASIWFASRADSSFHYRLRKPAFDTVTLRGLLKVGGSSIVEHGGLRLGFFFNNAIIASLGTVVFASFHIVSQVSSLSFTLGTA